MTDHDWRQERNEYVAGKLLDADEQAEWEAIRNVDLGLVRPTVSTEQMIARAAKARAELEGAWADRREREAWRRGYLFNGDPQNAPLEWVEKVRDMTDVTGETVTLYRDQDGEEFILDDGDFE